MTRIMGIDVISPEIEQREGQWSSAKTLELATAFAYHVNLGKVARSNNSTEAIPDNVSH